MERSLCGGFWLRREELYTYWDWWQSAALPRWWDGVYPQGNQTVKNISCGITIRGSAYMEHLAQVHSAQPGDLMECSLTPRRHGKPWDWYAMKCAGPDSRHTSLPESACRSSTLLMEVRRAVFKERVLSTTVSKRRSLQAQQHQGEVPRGTILGLYHGLNWLFLSLI